MAFTPAPTSDHKPPSLALSDSFPLALRLQPTDL